MNEHQSRVSNFLNILTTRPRPLIMGILNATPDSFWVPSRLSTNKRSIQKRVLAMVDQGADVIDVGGESTRPGADYVSEDEELRRIIPVIKYIREVSSIPLSIDTRKSKIASMALELGADIINDISGLRDDPEMVEVAKHFAAPVVIMHMQGNPKTMQQNPQYTNVVTEISEFLLQRANLLIQSGLPKELIIIDPGMGFGKTLAHNIEILQGLPELSKLGFPLLLAHGQKGFIGSILGKQGIPRPVDHRIFGTMAIVAHGFHRGVRMFRVHEPGPAWDTLRTMAVCGGLEHA